MLTCTHKLLKGRSIRFFATPLPFRKQLLHHYTLVKEGAHLPLEAQYDQKAIEKWLEEKDKSPMVNFALPRNILIPNYKLLSSMLILSQIV